MTNLHKRQIYGGLLEILKDSQYYYYSTIGSDYSHLTEDGKAAVLKYINQVAPYMIKENKEELQQLAKQMVIDELKK